MADSSAAAGQSAPRGDHREPLPGFSISGPQRADLEQRFDYHQPPSPAAGQMHGWMRRACLEAAVVVAAVAPRCREQSLALTKLEEAMFWANAALARNWPKWDPETGRFDLDQPSPEAGQTDAADRTPPLPMDGNPIASPAAGQTGGGPSPH